MLHWAVTLVGLSLSSSPMALERVNVCPSESVEVEGKAHFTVSSGDRSIELRYATPGNLVSCRTTSGSMVWIRLAEEPRDDGQGGPHLDIDVCNITVPQTFSPMLARGQPCPGGQTWAIWWHDGRGGVFANGTTSTDCVLRLEARNELLLGVFSCRGLEGPDVEGHVDVLEGGFECECLGARTEAGRPGPNARR